MERKPGNKSALRRGQLIPDEEAREREVAFLRNVPDKWGEQKNEPIAYTMLHGPPHSPLGSKRKTDSKEKQKEIILYIIAQHRH